MKTSKAQAILLEGMYRLNPSSKRSMSLKTIASSQSKTLKNAPMSKQATDIVTSRQSVLEVFIDSTVYVFLKGEQSPLLIVISEYLEDLQMIVGIDSFNAYIFIPYSSVSYILEYQTDDEGYTSTTNAMLRGNPRV